jgi:hypothetical protein
VNAAHRFTSDGCTRSCIKVSTGDITMPSRRSDVREVNAKITRPLADKGLGAHLPRRGCRGRSTGQLPTPADRFIVHAVSNEHGFSDFHRDDRGANVDKVTRFNMELLNGPSKWARQFDGGFGCFYFNDHLVHLDGVPWLHEPGEDFRFGQTLTNVRESENLMRH